MKMREVPGMLAHRARYYGSSVATLRAGLARWPLLACRALNPFRRAPFLVTLRPSGRRYLARGPLDVWVIKETCLDHEYECASLPLGDDWIVVDIGAGLGDFAIDAAARHPRSAVYAYEPDPHSFALLTTNIRLNRLTNIHPSRCAIGEPGTMRLDIAAPAAVRHRPLARGAPPSRSTMAVGGITLAEIFVMHRLSRCDYLKIDCEGGEYAILIGASDETLRKVRHICLEYHDDHMPFDHGDLVAFLEARNFRVTVRPSGTHRAIGLLYAAATGPR